MLTFETAWVPTRTSTAQLNIKDRFRPPVSSSTSRATATASKCSRPPMEQRISNRRGSRWRNARSQATCPPPKDSKYSPLDSKHTSSRGFTITQPIWHQGLRCSWRPRSPTISKLLAVKVAINSKTNAIDTDMNNTEIKTHKIDRIVTSKQVICKCTTTSHPSRRSRRSYIQSTNIHKCLSFIRYG